MPVSPPSNLPPASQVWGRDIEDRLRAMEQDAVKNSLDVNNSLSGTNSALKRLGEQVQTLADVVAEVQAQNAKILAQQNQINATVNALAGRVTVSAAAPTFNTGSIPTGGVMTWYTGNQASVTLNVPTGKMLITVNTGEASLSGGSGAMGAGVSYSVPTAGIGVGGPESRNFTPGGAIGGPLIVSRVVTVSPGVHTVNGVCGAYAFLAGMSVNFLSPVVTVQVIV